MMTITTLKAAVARAGALALAALICGTAAAQNAADGFPNRQVTIVAPFAPGGPADLFSRKQAEYLEKKFGVPFIVENVPGAGGIVAAKSVSGREADGYTWFSASGGLLTIIPAVIGPGDYDPAKELELVGVIRSQPLMLVTHKDSRFKSLQDVIDAAKAAPNTLTYGSIGVNSALHLAAMQLEDRAGISMIHVPYKGSAEYSVDLLGGRLDFAISTPGTLYSNPAFVALAQAETERSPMMPDVPTGFEAGVDGWTFDSWTGVAVKSGTPPELVAKIGDMLKAVDDDPQFRDDTKAMDASPLFISAADFADEVARQRAKNAELIGRVSSTN